MVYSRSTWSLIIAGRKSTPVTKYVIRAKRQKAVIIRPFPPNIWDDVAVFLWPSEVTVIVRDCSPAGRPPNRTARLFLRAFAQFRSHLRKDRNRDLGRRASANVEAYWAADTAKLGVREAVGFQPFQAFGMCASRPKRANVEGFTFQGG